MSREDFWREQSIQREEWLKQRENEITKLREAITHLRTENERLSRPVTKGAYNVTTSKGCLTVDATCVVQERVGSESVLAFYKNGVLVASIKDWSDVTVTFGTKD